MRDFDNNDTIKSMNTKVTKLTDLTFKNLTAYGEFKNEIQKKFSEFDESRIKAQAAEAVDTKRIKELKSFPDSIE